MIAGAPTTARAGDPLRCRLAGRPRRVGVHRVQDDRGDQKVEAVFEKVVDRHRDVPEHSAGTDDRPGEKHPDGHADEPVLLGPAAAVREQAHDKERAGADPRDGDDDEERNRALDSPATRRQWCAHVGHRYGRSTRHGHEYCTRLAADRFPTAETTRAAFIRTDASSAIHMSDTRARIRRHVLDTPGVHFNRLGRELDVATGQAQYHLRRLVRDDELAVERVAGRTHYFDPAFDPWERRTIAFLRRETARELIVRLYTAGPTRPTDLAEELGIARSTVAWHVSTLADAGVLEKSDSRPMTLRLAAPERTATLLETVSPSLPDRLLDRFTRTVDQLFE